MPIRNPGDDAGHSCFDCLSLLHSSVPPFPLNPPRTADAPQPDCKLAIAVDAMVSQVRDPGGQSDAAYRANLAVLNAGRRVT